MKPRDKRYDLLRVVAMAAVILIHTLDLQPAPTGRVALAIHETVMSLLLLANPLFFMMSGHFNLHFKGETPRAYAQFYAKRLIALVLPLVVYELLYQGVSAALAGQSLLTGAFWHDYVRNVLQDYNTTYFWFMYALIAFVLAAPFLSRLFDGLNPAGERVFWAVAFSILGFGWVLRLRGITFALNGYPFGGWLLYFLLGRSLERVKAPKGGCAALAVLCILTLNSGLTVLVPQSVKWGLHDMAPSFFALAVIVYLRFLDSQAMARVAKRAWVPRIARYTYSVYLAHGAALLVVSFNEWQRVWHTWSLVLTFGLVALSSLSFAVAFDALILGPIQRALLAQVKRGLAKNPSALNKPR